MSIKFRRAISSTKDMKSGSVSSLRDTVGDRKIQKFPLPYSFVCTPNQERNFTEEVHAACRRIHEINQEMLRLTKVIVVGDVAVGKTCLVRRFCLHPFDTNYKATIGVDFEAMKCYILNIPYILQVWDTAGQEKFKCIAQSYYRGAKVVLLVFDFTHLNSLYNIPKWLERTLQCAENPLLFLVGTKKDKVAKSAYKLTEQEAVRIANDMGAEYWPVSSKTGCFFMDPPDSLWFLMDPYNHPQDWEGENVEALISRIAVVSFCRDVVKEAETAKEFHVSDDFVKISKSTSPKKKDKKCASCT